MATVRKLDTSQRRWAIDLTGAHLPGMDLSHADLAGSKFAEANLTAMNFKAANLHEADLHGANLIAADFTEADLTEANLSEANLSGAVLSSTALEGANFSGANLSATHLEGADLTAVQGVTWRQLLDASFDESTVPPAYLEEEDLFRLLEQTEPTVQWRLEFAVGEVWAALAAIRLKVGDGSILTKLMLHRAEREIGVENLLPDD